MARSHAESGLVKLYMAAKGVALRTAQLHAKNRHGDYVAFLATQGAKALEVSDPSEEQKRALFAVMGGQTPPGDRLVHVAPPAMEKPQDQWTPEEYAECQVWAGLVATHAQRMAALERGDSMAACGFVKIANDTVKAYHLARQRRVQAELESGRLQPMSAWQDAKSAILKLVVVWEYFLTRLAQKVNPDNPQFALRVIMQSKEDELNPAVENLIAELTL